MNGKEELEKLKSMTWKKRLEYLKDYYKWYFIGGLFALFLLCGLIGAMLQNGRETVLSCTWVNEEADYVDVEQLASDYGAYLGLDTGMQRLLFDSGLYIDPGSGDSYSLSSQSRLSVLWKEGDQDILIGDPALMELLSQSGWFSDLEEALPADLKAALTPYLLYLKGEDGESRAYGLDITAASINPAGDHSTPYAHVLCLPVTGHRQDAVWQFLRYIFGLQAQI